MPTVLEAVFGVQPKTPSSGDAAGDWPSVPASETAVHNPGSPWPGQASRPETSGDALELAAVASASPDDGAVYMPPPIPEPSLAPLPGSGAECGPDCACRGGRGVVDEVLEARAWLARGQS